MIVKILNIEINLNTNKKTWILRQEKFFIYNSKIYLVFIFIEKNV